MHAMLVQAVVGSGLQGSPRCNPQEHTAPTASSSRAGSNLLRSSVLNTYWKLPLVQADFAAFRHSSVDVHAPSQVQVHCPSVFSITVQGPCCSATTDMLFYARIIGPSVSWVNVSRAAPCSYTAVFTAGEPGNHILELVCEYCGVRRQDADWDWASDRPYIGAALLTHSINVAAQRRGWSLAPVCADSTSGAPQQGGYWTHGHSWHGPSREEGPSCVTLQDSAPLGATATSKQQHNLTVVLIGDSVMMQQAAQLRAQYPSWLVKRLYLNFGLENCDNFQRLLNSRMQSAVHADVLVFNTGLHDYSHRVAHKNASIDSFTAARKACCSKWMPHLPTWDPAVYAERLRLALAILSACHPDAVLIFRSTTAAWLKHGNTHATKAIAGQVDGAQRFWTTWRASVMLNRVAEDVVRHTNNNGMRRWWWLDGLSMSLSMPNCTDPRGGAASFVHPCDDVYRVLNSGIASLVELARQTTARTKGRASPRSLHHCDHRILRCTCELTDTTWLPRHLSFGIFRDPYTDLFGADYTLNGTALHGTCE